MGNSNSAQPSRASRDRKREATNSADTNKGRRPVNGNSKLTSRRSRSFNKCRVGPRTTNPFIIFFLRLHNKKPKEHVTVTARAAGKIWSRMTPEQRKKYVDLANEEKKRRQDKKRKRKHIYSHI